MTNQFYPANFAALALNFGEQIYDAYEPETEEQHNRYLLKALSLAGHSQIDIAKLNASIQYYMESADVDLYDFPEYGEQAPDIFDND